MKSQFTLDNPMPPVWMMYPDISQYSIGWRMGGGEDYKYKLLSWLDRLSPQQQRQYQQMFPAPKAWRGYYTPEDQTEDGDDFICGHVVLWNRHGEMAYSRDKLMCRYNSGDRPEYLFFWKPNHDAADKTCLGQWQHSTFHVDTDTYRCAEQYMMAEKACLFDDSEIEKQIMNATDAKHMKALGQKIRHFDQALWDKAKHAIVLNANYYKFTQNRPMRDFLLSTGNKVLVEASPLDTIWGIGLGEDNPNAINPNRWRGTNLLGFALMEVRDDLRKVYANYHKIDWSQFSAYQKPE
ncbi:NADAR family protein [Budvicia aquatica]|uniref:NADAR family protein n=1 Tax=Budvicia aquatica TaxID=82979 RepID=UPI002085D4CC|nr:NADAR family protein [Budvicia aquatica]GKX52155.1 hypothetical protein SOASR029_24640 [Budvicia aquatica]